MILAPPPDEVPFLPSTGVAGPKAIAPPMRSVHATKNLIINTDQERVEMRNEMMRISVVVDKKFAACVSALVIHQKREKSGADFFLTLLMVRRLVIQI